MAGEAGGVAGGGAVAGGAARGNDRNERGKAGVTAGMAGMNFIMETLTDGDILLKHAVVVPVNERWLHEPAMKQQLARADEWMRNNPAKETSLAEFEGHLEIAS